ncbi:MAG: fused MFS/spermidine synthase [Nitrospinota bacterium]|nr:fused MFS/spermidine synthase [Nitrospinota bacterium]
MIFKKNYQNQIPFLLFFISGFCGLLYQVIWLRLGFRAFGVITPVLSVVISVFMSGLALGSWAGGKWIGEIVKKTKVSPIYLYAIAEFFIGIGAFVVPHLYSLSETYLLSFGEMDSFPYLLLSALLIVVCILPWCTLMGVTFPFMMAFLKGQNFSEKTSFSLLYLANVIGAMSGTLITILVLIELLGFNKTLLLAGLANFMIAIISVIYGRTNVAGDLKFEQPEQVNQKHYVADSEKPYLFTTILFITGFSAMGLEVVWIRAFTPVLNSTVYAFAYLVSMYLFATWIGSFYYRKDMSQKRARSNANLFAWLAIFVFLPVVINDPRINENSFILLFSIFPFCMVLGYLTPKIIDLHSNGFPEIAGRAYAVNIFGSILGPLFASYIFLPLMGSKYSMVFLAVPYVIISFVFINSLVNQRVFRFATVLISVTLLLSSLLISISYEERFGLLNFSKNGVVRRDHTATITSYGQGMKKRLFVNGISITSITAITKVMAHLPLALSKNKPESALLICFGMGPTCRSLMSWPIEVTGVELVPSVTDAFGYYFSDAEKILDDPRSKIIVDDGRRFLKRTEKKFDIITIDPPPPVETAGSSFLYSRDFYEIAKLRLKEGGILHQWLPSHDKVILNGVTRAIVSVFPYVKIFPSIEDWGVHYLASMNRIDIPPVEILVSRFSDRARNDLLEWNKGINLKEMVRKMVGVYSTGLMNIDANDDRLITDDRPINEYFMLRRFLAKWKN